VVNTHGHIDHVGAVADVCEEAGDIPFTIHPKDISLVEQVGQSAMMYGLPAPRIPKVDKEIADDDEVFHFSFITVIYLCRLSLEIVMAKYCTLQDTVPEVAASILRTQVLFL
jgi:glyoxylase-like metal-dependent hydrolase (beta-lactamase superfamily II)